MSAWMPTVDQNRLTEVKKRRRKNKKQRKKSTPLQIHIHTHYHTYPTNDGSGTQSVTSMSNVNNIQQQSNPNLSPHQYNLHLSNRNINNNLSSSLSHRDSITDEKHQTSPSPSLFRHQQCHHRLLSTCSSPSYPLSCTDAPAANPEDSEIEPSSASVSNTAAGCSNLETVTHTQTLEYDPEHLSSPSRTFHTHTVSLSRTTPISKSIDIYENLCPEVIAITSAKSIANAAINSNLLVETIEKNRSQQKKGQEDKRNLMQQMEIVNSDIELCDCQKKESNDDANIDDTTNDDDDDCDDDDDDEDEEDGEEEELDENEHRKKTPKQIKSKHRKAFENLICTRYHNFRKLIAKFVSSKYFRRIVLTAIVINTLSMGIEYHGQSISLTNALEYSNVVFTTLFALEMIFKLFAEGFLKYIKNAYNLFDGGIVVMSVIELQGKNNSGLSVLRTFRLLRVLKLVRFMPTLRRQLVVMLKTMDNVATFFSLLILFIFIFSILGMHIFGGEFCTLSAYNITSREEFDMKCRCCQCKEINEFKNRTDLRDVECIEERKNFDTLKSSLLTVFQVLTQEDWNEVLYNGMEKTSAWAALYFIALMTFGNYVLFNLLVAILVEGFSTEKGGDNDSNTDKLSKADPFKTEALLTGNCETPANPHGSPSIIQKHHGSNRTLDHDGKIYRGKEVKIMSIPKIAISNEDDSSLRIIGPPQITRTGPTPNQSNRNSPLNFDHPMLPQTSPYKSIIKHTNQRGGGSSSIGNNSISSTTTSPKKDELSTSKTPSFSSCKSHFEIAATATQPAIDPSLPNTDCPECLLQQQQNLLIKEEHHITGENDTEYDVSDLSTIETSKLLNSIVESNQLTGVSSTTVPNTNASLKRRDTISSASSTIAKDVRKLFTKNRSFSVSSESDTMDSTRTCNGSSDNAAANNNSTHHFEPNFPSPPPLPIPPNNPRNSLISVAQIIREERKLLNNQRTLIPYVKNTNNNASVRRTNSYKPTTNRRILYEENDVNNQQNNAPRLKRRSTLDNSFNYKSVKMEVNVTENNLSVSNCEQEQPQSSQKVELLNKNTYESANFVNHIIDNEERITKEEKESNLNRNEQRLINDGQIEQIEQNCQIDQKFNKSKKEILSSWFRSICPPTKLKCVIASGLIFGENTYLHTGWNIMDGFLVIISVIDIVTMSRDVKSGNENEGRRGIFGMLRVFRLLRTLRPLRVISRAPGLKLVVQTLLSSLRPIGHIVVICCTFFIIFGILGVQ
ncbi:unnamed protein product, partial [Didymodactylos carnosus]